jgi:hypothetical protein
MFFKFHMHSYSSFLYFVFYCYLTSFFLPKPVISSPLELFIYSLHSYLCAKIELCNLLQPILFPLWKGLNAVQVLWLQINLIHSVSARILVYSLTCLKDTCPILTSFQLLHFLSIVLAPSLFLLLTQNNRREITCRQILKLHTFAELSNEKAKLCAPYVSSGVFAKTFCKIKLVCICTFVCPHVYLFSCNNSRTTGLIFMRFQIWKLQ